MAMDHLINAPPEQEVEEALGSDQVDESTNEVRKCLNI